MMKSTVFINICEFHQVSSNLQVVQFLNETKQLLRQMIRVTNIEVKVSIMVSTIADLSYAWERFATERCFVAEIQDIIRRDPRLTIQMRSASASMSTFSIAESSASCRVWSKPGGRLTMRRPV